MKQVRRWVKFVELANHGNEFIAEFNDFSDGSLPSTVVMLDGQSWFDLGAPTVVAIDVIGVDGTKVHSVELGPEENRYARVYELLHSAIVGSSDPRQVLLEVGEEIFGVDAFPAEGDEG